MIKLHSVLNIFLVLTPGIIDMVIISKKYFCVFILLVKHIFNVKIIYIRSIKCLKKNCVLERTRCSAKTHNLFLSFIDTCFYLP